MDYTLEDYIAFIQQWAIDRNIIAKQKEIPELQVPEGTFFPIGGGTVIGQARKLLEEASEALEAAALLQAQVHDRHADEHMKDAIGDTFVVLVILASGMNFDLTHQCVRKAWNEIKDRKGKMINGKFVKEADLPSEDTESAPQPVVYEQRAAPETTGGE